MGSRTGCIRMLLILVVLFVLFSATSVWLVWKRPLAVDAFTSRFALGRLGLEKTVMDGPAGPMTVWEGGSGPAMVLLHGAGDQAGAWARVARPLLERYRLVIPDLPGHSKSEPRTGPLDVGVILEGVSMVVEQRCAGERPIVVGNSMGAWLAALYAREHPERVERLVFVNGGPLTGRNAELTLYPEDREQARKVMDAVMGPDSPRIPDNVLDVVVRRSRTGPLARLGQTASQMGPYILDGRLSEVTAPVDLVWGSADGLMPMDYAQRLLDGLPAARLHEVERCGHLPHRECPSRFLEALDQALGQPPPRPETVAEDDVEVQP